MHLKVSLVYCEVFGRSGLSDLFSCLNWIVRLFFSYFAVITKLNASLPIIFQFFQFREIFAHQHGSLFFIPIRATSLLASFSRRNFGTRSLKSENSEVTYSNASKEMQNDERMDTQKVEKMKGQTTRQTARKTAISNWFKNFFTETPWNDIPIKQDRGTENKPSHSIPFQKYLVWQVQFNDPRVFVQLAPPLVQILSHNY